MIEAEEHAGRGNAPVPSWAPFPIADAEHGYYGLPLLKRPTWTGSPVALFIGGTAGACAGHRRIARMSNHPTLARDARWIAVAGAAIAPY